MNASAAVPVRRSSAVDVGWHVNRFVGFREEIEPMPTPQTDLKTEARRTLDEIRTLRDEVRVQLHLASMDAKDQWKKLEPRVADAEQLALDVGETSRAALKDVLGRIRKFRASLRS
jgi:hypothetical protein